MARRSRVLLLALAAAFVGSAAAAGRALQQADASDPAPSGTPTRSGLELVVSSAGSGSFLGRQLDDLGGSYPTSLYFDTATDGLGSYTHPTYGFVDTIQSINMTIGNATRAPFNNAGMGLNSDYKDAISKPFLWLTDIGGNTVYKVDTVTGTVAGSFYSQPTNAGAGNPALVGVDSAGDAWVGNAYTFASNSVGSLVKIGSDPAGCGTSGTFSTGSSPKAFASTVTISSIYAGVASGYQTLLDTLRGSADPTSTYVATLQGASADSCIKRFESLAVQDSTANTVAISAIAIDGADNTYAVAVNEKTRFAGYLRIYGLPQGQDNQPTTIGSATNAATNAAADLGLPVGPTGAGTGFSMPASGQTDGPGAPGGYDAVVDKYGFLWTGAGDYQWGATLTNPGQANSSSLSGGQYGVLRIPVGAVAGTGLGNYINSGNPTFFPVTHETNALALAPDGSLWVAGQASASLFPTDPRQLTEDLVTASFGIWTPTVVVPLDTTGCALASGLGSDSVDPCCAAGSYNGGIAINKFSGSVYVSNECQIGKVARLTPTGTNNAYELSSTILGTGTALSFPSSINADYAGNVWVTSSNFNDNTGSTSVYKIATGNAASADPVSGLTFASSTYVGGSGDHTGVNTVQPPASGSWSWIHDTGIPSYDKWGTGFPSAKVAFSLLNTTSSIAGTTVPTPATLSIKVYTSNDCLFTGTGATVHGPSTFTATTSTLSSNTITLGAGQCIQITATLTRGSKVAPEIGPQAVGVSPVLALVNLVPANQNPIATCRDVTAIPADDDVAQPDNRVCGVANNIGGSTDVNSGSLEPDTAEFDTLATITAGSYSTNYFTWSNPTLTSAVTQPVTAGWTAASAAAYPWLSGYSAVPSYSDAQPGYTQNTSTQVTLSLTDAHGGSDTCSGNVQLLDTIAPVWRNGAIAQGVTPSTSQNLASDVDTLCAWPPSYKYYCWLDVTSNVETEILPLYDNCAGSFPLIKQGPETFTCTDTDPRTQDGDCVLQYDTIATTAAGGRPVYNLCVKAQLRTTYTGLDRIYYANFNVLDGGTFQNHNSGTPFTRAIRVPPLWKFNVKSECPRAQYDYSASSVGAVDTSQSVDSPPAAGR